MSWESTGTVTVTNNSNTVTGVGTVFASASRVGDAFIAPDGSLYEIDNVISNTSLSINPPYAGATQVGATYRIAPIRGYQKLAADRLFQILNTIEDSISTAVEAQLPPWVRDPLTPVPLDKGGTGGTTPEQSRLALELGNSSTRNVGTTPNTVAAGDDSRFKSFAPKNQINPSPIVEEGEVLRRGSFGIGSESPLLPIPTSISWQPYFNANSILVGDPVAPYVSFILMQREAAMVGSNDGTTAWSATLYHDKNLLDIGTTAATARAALELPAAGEGWIDLRPYLTSGFYWSSSRDGRNSIPRGRVLPCGRIELQGVINHNETSGPLVNGVVLNLPEALRPKYTSGHIVFGDSSTPLAFYSVNLLVAGEVEYAPPSAHGDIMAVFSTGTPQTSVTEAAIVLNGVIMYKE